MDSGLAVSAAAVSSRCGLHGLGGCSAPACQGWGEAACFASRRSGLPPRSQAGRRRCSLAARRNPERWDSDPRASSRTRSGRAACAVRHGASRVGEDSCQCSVRRRGAQRARGGPWAASAESRATRRTRPHATATLPRPVAAGPGGFVWVGCDARKHLISFVWFSGRVTPQLRAGERAAGSGPRRAVRALALAPPPPSPAPPLLLPRPGGVHVATTQVHGRVPSPLSPTARSGADGRKHVQLRRACPPSSHRALTGVSGARGRTRWRSQRAKMALSSVFLLPGSVAARSRRSFGDGCSSRSTATTAGT